MKFSFKDLFSKCDQKPQQTADLVASTEEILKEENLIFCLVMVQTLISTGGAYNLMANSYSSWELSDFIWKQNFRKWQVKKATGNTA